jgi:hypothetical protein
MHYDLARKFLLASAAVLVFAVACYTKADPDLWGHLRTGLDTLGTHHLPSIDPYSFTQDRPLVYHEWLSEWQMAAAYAVAGTVGLTLLKGALTCAALVIVWTALTNAAPAAAILALGATAIGTASVTQTLRPQLWTLVFLGLLARLLPDDRPKRHWWLPLLFAIWANSHGGWIVGLGVLGAWAAGDVLVRPSRLVHWMPVVVASVLATLCTPYGLTLWRFIAGTVHLSRPAIEDWQPLWHLAPPQWVPWIVTAAAAVWGVTQASKHRLSLLAVTIVLAYASLRVARVSPLFTEVTVTLLGPLIAVRWPHKATKPAPLSRADTIVVAAMCLLALGGASWMGRSSLSCVSIEDSPAMPDRAAASLLESAEPGRLVTFFNWGEYAIWHFGPALRVSMDGRREAVYSDARLAEHDAILFGTPAGFETLQEWRPEYVWLPASSGATRDWLAAHGYRIEFNSPRSFVAVRQDLPPLKVGAPTTTGACFPG